jgi:hypothetical protein
MAEPFDFTGQNIEDTYQRVLQTDGINFYDGTGSVVNIGTTDTGSLLITASASPTQYTITFEKGNGDTFDVTIPHPSPTPPTSPFPYTGSAEITGSLQVIGNTTLKGNRSDLIVSGNIYFANNLNGTINGGTF